MNNTQNEIATLKSEIAYLEKEAIKHEGLARECRTQREHKKQELSKLLSQVNDAKVVHAVESSLTIINQCRDDIKSLREQLKMELSSIVSLKSQLEERLKESTDGSGHET